MNEPDDAPARGDKQTAGISRLRRRADFLRAARGQRSRTDAFSLQANRRAGLLFVEEDPDGLGARVGITVTRKLGGAAARNRIRRRLREALRLSADLETRAGYDYVLMAQQTVLRRRFDLLQADMKRAFLAVHARPGRQRLSADRDEQK